LCIEEVHPTLTRAAQAAFGFLSVSRMAKVLVLHRYASNEFITIDRQTFQANRGSMKYAACGIVFQGGILELRAIAAAVPAELFTPDPPAPEISPFPNQQEG
jgi:hypothetical protein